MSSLLKSAHLNIGLENFLSPSLMNHVDDVYQNPDDIESNFLTRGHHQETKQVIQKRRQKCNSSWKLDCMCGLQVKTNIYNQVNNTEIILLIPQSGMPNSACHYGVTIKA
jgi:hypothetical protein